MAFMLCCLDGKDESFEVTTALTDGFVRDSTGPWTLCLTYRGQVSLTFANDFALSVLLNLMRQLSPVPCFLAVVDTGEISLRLRLLCRVRFDDIETLRERERIQTLLALFD